MNCKILNTIGNNYSESAREILDRVARVDYLNVSHEKLKQIIKKYDILIIGLGLTINREIIDNAINLKIIATATTGTDHIDVDYANSKSIKIISLKDETKFLNTITSTAELSFGLMIDLLRKTHGAFNSVKRHEWQRDNFRGHSLYGKTIGIVGLGRLGKMMSKYCNAFNMRVMGFDPNVGYEDFKKVKCLKVEFKELLKQSDIISIHIHLNKSTENMFNTNVFKQMKRGVCIINTSRGKIINEKNLIVFLKNKRVAGYAADVLSNELDFEKTRVNNPLIDYSIKNDNVVIVPHIGGMTYESRENTDIFVAKMLIKNLNSL